MGKAFILCQILKTLMKKIIFVLLLLIVASCTTENEEPQRSQEFLNEHPKNRQVGFLPARLCHESKERLICTCHAGPRLSPG